MDVLFCYDVDILSECVNMLIYFFIDLIHSSAKVTLMSATIYDLSLLCNDTL